MRVLFVAMSDSIHAVRWIRQVADQGWDLHLFPSIDLGYSHPEFTNLTIHHSVYSKPGRQGRGVTARGLYLPAAHAASVARRGLREYWPSLRRRQLARLIDRLRPDIVHSMEFQASAYLTLQAKALASRPFPTWLVTNWGSDIYLFGRLAAHRERIAQVLSECDYYSCECQRDVSLARLAGLRGEALPVLPNSGGFDLDAIGALRSAGRPSQRRVIMLKGYQHWAGRALVGLRALERCADALKGYTVVIYAVEGDVALATELFAANTGLDVVVLPKGLPHQQILEHHGKARISIGLSISDAISTSFIEAMAMGSFPIQSDTCCGTEWAEHGRTALFVPPEDPDVIESAIRRALADDALVDGAAEANWRTVQSRLDASKIVPQVLQIYRRIGGKRDLPSA